VEEDSVEFIRDQKRLQELFYCCMAITQCNILITAQCCDYWVQCFLSPSKKFVT